MSTIRFLMGGGFGRIFANEKQGRIPTNHQALVMPRISVIIPTYNRASMVCECVASVLATGWPELDLIVVDDFSPDNTAEELKRRFGQDRRVRYLRNERNSFQAVSRNNGAKVATGEYFFFLDDDNKVDTAVFTELIAVFGRHPDAGVVAPLAIHQRPGKENVIWTLGSDFNRWTSQPRDNMPNLPAGELPAEPVEWPTTYSPNAFLVPRRVFEEVGGFNEGYVQIFEESDFGWNVVEAGHGAWIAARAVTIHLGFLESGCTPELRQLGIEKPYRTFCFARNRLRFARRHFSFLQILSVAFVFAPLSAAYYCAVAIKNSRFDIAWAYLKGTLVGVFGIWKRH